MKNNVVIISAFPKSGSSYLNNLCATLFDYNKDIACFIRKSNEQDLYLPKIEELLLLNGTVVRHHFRATHNNIQIIEENNLKNIVLVRNIYDVLVSWKDDFLKGLPKQNTCIGGFGGIGYVSKSFLELSNQKQNEYLIDILAPWLIQYYASWYNYAQNNSNILILTYEDLVENTSSNLKNIGSFHEKDFSQDYIDNVINKVSLQLESNNFNVGKQGRGNILSKDLIEKTKKFKLYYPEVDFSLIGL